MVTDFFFNTTLRPNKWIKISEFKQNSTQKTNSKFQLILTHSKFENSLKFWKLTQIFAVMVE